MRQVAALPYRFAGANPGEVVEVLLVTSFRSRRWIIPKGNVDEGMLPHQAAAKEAEEEGGVRGKIGEQAIGTYCYGKLLDDAGNCQLEVDVYPLHVENVMADWPEKSFRERIWLPIREASEAVSEPGLAAIMQSFAPDVIE
jgi:8-oxo-dGTP pyrophosphatase MutT (NUDIX family)